MSAIIESEHLRKSFGENERLKDINMNVNKRRSCHHYRFFWFLVNQRYYVVLIC